jgi:hypothetical protein
LYEAAEEERADGLHDGAEDCARALGEPPANPTTTDEEG